MTPFIFSVLVVTADSLNSLQTAPPRGSKMICSVSIQSEMKSTTDKDFELFQGETNTWKHNTLTFLFQRKRENIDRE